MLLAANVHAEFITSVSARFVRSDNTTRVLHLDSNRPSEQFKSSSKDSALSGSLSIGGTTEKVASWKCLAG